MYSNEQNTEECAIFLKIIKYLLLILYFVSMLLCFIFVIIGLVNTSISSQIKLCYESNIWIYNLTSSITLISNQLVLLHIRIYYLHDDIINTMTCICYVLINIIMATWGIYEFYYVKCINNLEETIFLVCILIPTMIICQIITKIHHTMDIFTL